MDQGAKGYRLSRSPSRLREDGQEISPSKPRQDSDKAVSFESNANRPRSGEQRQQESTQKTNASRPKIISQPKRRDSTYGQPLARVTRQPMSPRTASMNALPSEIPTRPSVPSYPYSTPRYAPPPAILPGHRSDYMSRERRASPILRGSSPAHYHKDGRDRHSSRFRSRPRSPSPNLRDRQDFEYKSRRSPSPDMRERHRLKDEISELREEFHRYKKESMQQQLKKIKEEVQEGSKKKMEELKLNETGIVERRRLKLTAERKALEEADRLRLMRSKIEEEVRLKVESEKQAEVAALEARAREEAEFGKQSRDKLLKAIEEITSLTKTKMWKEMDAETEMIKNRGEERERLRADLLTEIRSVFQTELRAEIRAEMKTVQPLGVKGEEVMGAGVKIQHTPHFISNDHRPGSSVAIVSVTPSRPYIYHDCLTVRAPQEEGQKLQERPPSTSVPPSVSGPPHVHDEGSADEYEETHYYKTSSPVSRGSSSTSRSESKVATVSGFEKFHPVGTYSDSEYEGNPHSYPSERQTPQEPSRRHGDSASVKQPRKAYRLYKLRTIPTKGRGRLASKHVFTTGFESTGHNSKAVPHIATTKAPEEDDGRASTGSGSFDGTSTRGDFQVSAEELGKSHVMYDPDLLKRILEKHISMGSQEIG